MVDKIYAVCVGDLNQNNVIDLQHITPKLYTLYFDEGRIIKRLNKRFAALTSLQCDILEFSFIKN